MFAPAHPVGREVRVELRNRGVVSYLGEQPYIAQPGKEEVAMGSAPAALQVPGPHAHTPIMADASTGWQDNDARSISSAPATTRLPW